MHEKTTFHQTSFTLLTRQPMSAVYFALVQGSEMSAVPDPRFIRVKEIKPYLNTRCFTLAVVHPITPAAREAAVALLQVVCAQTQLRVFIVFFCTA